MVMVMAWPTRTCGALALEAAPRGSTDYGSDWEPFSPDGSHSGLMETVQSHALDAPGEETYLLIASPQTVSRTHAALQHACSYRFSRCNNPSPVSGSPLSVYTSNTPFLPRAHIVDWSRAYLLSAIRLFLTHLMDYD